MKKLKITKNSYIVDKINEIKFYKIKLHKDITDGIYDIILFNCNFYYDINVSIKNNIIELKSDIYIQDKKILICIDKIVCFDNILFSL